MDVPQILITIGFRNDVTPYAQSVARAGADPVIGFAREDGFIVPRNISGIVLGGGASVEPRRYGAQHDPHINRSEDLPRDTLEFGVVEQAIERGIPILGICRGLQLLNVYGGGTLIQNLPATNYSLDHRPDAERTHIAHTAIATGGRLQDILGAGDIPVNSIHRQGVDRLATCYTATVHSPDGLIEGLENDTGSILAVQWHPEELSPTQPSSANLFTDLVERARNYDAASVFAG